MSWTDRVECWSCHNAEFHVVKGVWTCTCGAVMYPEAVKSYHKLLDAEKGV